MPKKLAVQSRGVIYAQKNGPYTPATPFERGQAGLGDINLPGPGDTTVFYFTDSSGNPVAGGRERSAPGQPSTTIENYLGFARDLFQKWREQGTCHNLQARFHSCRDLDDPSGWDLAIHMGQALTGDATLSSPISREFADARIEQGTPDSPLYDFIMVRHAPQRQVTTEAENIVSIDFVSDPEGCEGCGNGYPGPDQIGYALAAPAAAAQANVLYTTNGGSTWAATSAQLPTANASWIDVQVFFLNRTQLLVVAGNATTDAGTPAKIARAIVNLGAEGTTTWASVNVNSTNGEVIEALRWDPNGRKLYAAAAGDLYESLDQGQTWTQVTAGSNAIAQIRVAPSGDVYAVGASNTLLRRVGGEGAFVSLTGPGGALSAISIANTGALWVGSGQLVYYSQASDPSQAGLWTQSQDFGSGFTIQELDVKGGQRAAGGDSQVVHAVVSSASNGQLYLTLDGGGLWEQLDTLFTGAGNQAGYTAAYWSKIDPNLGWIVGPAEGSLGMIAKVSPTAGV